MFCAARAPLRMTDALSGSRSAQDDSDKKERLPASANSEVITQMAEAFDLQQTAAANIGADLTALQHPGVVMGHEDGVQTGLERRVNVGLGTIADHPGLLGQQAILLDHAAIGGSIFFGQHLDGGEVLLESRALELSGLLRNVSFGDEKEMMTLGQVGQGLGNFRQDFHGMLGNSVSEAANGVVQGGGQRLDRQMLETF